MNSRLRLALDFGPLFVFFLAYKAAGVLAATAALIACTLLSLAITYGKERRIAIMPLVSGVLVTILGGLTLFLHDDTFIKIKPTLVNLLFASVLLGGVVIGRPVLKYLLDDALQMTDVGWRKLSLRWGIFFLFLAALNEIVWRHTSTDFWVNFKVFGMFGLSMLFTFSQIPLIKRYWVEESTS